MRIPVAPEGWPFIVVPAAAASFTVVTLSPSFSARAQLFEPL